MPGAEAQVVETETTDQTQETSETQVEQTSVDQTTDQTETTEDRSIGEGGGRSDDQVNVQPAYPDDWRQRWAGNREDDLKRLNRFKSPEGVWKSYRALEQRLSSGEMIPVKPDPADAEAMAAWRTQVGIPETPEGYFDVMPEGMEIPEGDKEQVGDYFKRMHELGVPPEAAAEGVKSYYETAQKAEERLAEFDRRNRTETEDALREEWGAEYRGNLSQMHNMLSALAPEGFTERLFMARMPDGRPLGDDQQTLQFLVSLANEINPTGTVTPVPGQTRSEGIEKRIAEIESEMGDTKGREPGGYWNSPEKQEEYRRLLDAQEKIRR